MVGGVSGRMVSLLCGKVGLEEAIGVDENEPVQFVLQRRVDNAVSHPYTHTVPRADAERSTRDCVGVHGRS